MSSGSKAKPDRVNLFDPAFVAHPQPTYRRLRDECPVAHDVIGGRVLSRHQDVLFALRHPEIFSSGMAATALGNERPLIPLQIDPPEQTKYRKILDPLFSRKRTLTLEPDVRALANKLIDGFADRGECEFSRDFAIPYPCTVFLRLMGLPYGDLDELLAMKNGIIRADVKDPADAPQARAQTARSIYAYFERMIEEKSRQPREDVLSTLLEAEVEGERLSRNDILDVCFLFLLGGLDTVTASLGCGVVYLARHPEQRRKLVEDPSIIPSAVEELLRWETPVVGVARVVKQDVEIAGEKLPAGQPVTLLLGAADTDEAEFDDPERVDLQRARNRHLAFGGGHHRCLGSHLARMELQVALEELHRRIPDYALKPDESPRYGLGIREVQHLPLVF
jgi:cytochrome P450